MDKIKTKKYSCVQPLTFEGETHVGLIRDANEDCFCYIDYQSEANSMAVIADGIGGHQHGEIASSLCCRQLVTSWKFHQVGNLSSTSKIEAFLKHQICSVNRDIYLHNKRKNAGCSMGTTIVAAVFTPNHVIVGHAGDSRLYMYNEDEGLRQLTEDHSLVAALVKKGTISNEEAKHHPFAHIISKSIGPNVSVEPEIKIYPRNPGDRYMLCSDGLSMHVKRKKVRDIIATSATSKSAVNSLMKEALISGGEDNITIICIF